MYKLGRTPRGRDPRVPHLSSLINGRKLPAPPASVDYSHGMPTKLGMMGNDEWGDCTAADEGHSVQVWSYNAQKHMLTPTDQEILALYSGVTGFDPNAGPPGHNPTDQGANMQAVMDYLMKHGIPLPGGKTTKVLLYVEVDVRNKQDIQRIIHECGVCHIGFDVPAYLLPGGPPPKQWVLDPAGDQTIIGGHDVALVGYDANWLTLASWGAWYQMSWDFFEQFTEEAYGIACQMWVEKTGKTPAGLTVQQMETLMKALAVH